ncbi:MAG: CoA transferase [Streptosporangiales bacterium]|nr:CoA transferase [Streptosporangiales bacterium]
MPSRFRSARGRLRFRLPPAWRATFRDPRARSSVLRTVGLTPGSVPLVTNEIHGHPLVATIEAVTIWSVNAYCQTKSLKLTSNLVTRALDGLFVLDLGQIYNGSYCGVLLSYLGAEVVKVESPAGDPTRWRVVGRETHPFVMLNSNKKGVRLDLKTERGKDLFLRLVERADVLVENFAPGTMQRLGLGYPELERVNPRLVYASGKGYGSTGPHRDYPAMDLTIQAMTAVMATTGFDGHPPVKAGIAPADFMGGVHLAASVLAALYQRERTGRGQLVEVSMQDALLPSLTSALGGYFESGGTLPEQTGNRHNGLSVCPYNVYPAKDGWIAILCMTDRHWQALCRLMGRADLADDPELATTPGRCAQMDMIDEVVGDWTRPQTKADLFQLVTGAHIPAAPLVHLTELVADPHLRERGMLRDVDHPTMGRVTVYGNPLRLGDSEPVEPRAAPLHGEHTDEVLREHLGLPDEELRRLHEEGVI